MKGRFINLSSVMTNDGTLSLSGHTTNCNSVVEAVDPPEDDTAVTLAFQADLDEGSQLDESEYPTIVFHFTPDVTTVQDFENDVAASQHMAVTSTGTEANVLQETADEFTAVTLASGSINAANCQAQIDMTGMVGSSVFLDQLVDAGTVTLLVEKSIDGTNWATVVTKHETDFPAGANKSIEVTLSDTNGMPLVAKAVRVTASALSGGGVYGLHAAGKLLDGYR